MYFFCLQVDGPMTEGGGGGAAYKWGRLLAGVYGIYLTGHNAEQREGFRQTMGNFQSDITR